MLLNLKKEKLLLDKIQQLSSNSWEDTVVRVILGPENAATGGRERKSDGCGKLLGGARLTETDLGQNQNLN